MTKQQTLEALADQEQTINEAEKRMYELLSSKTLLP